MFRNILTYTNTDLKLPFIMRKASLQMTKAPAFQTLLESTQILILVGEMAESSSPLLGQPNLVCFATAITTVAIQISSICEGVQANKMKSKEITSFI